MVKDCLICNRISLIEANNNPYFVKELTAGYVVLGDYQFYKGYTLFLSKRHVSELHQLGSLRKVYLEEMAIVAESVYKAFNPDKLNYELLGNKDRHLHWHIIPRYVGDPNLTSPIWVIDERIRNVEKEKPSLKELTLLTNLLNKKIDILLKNK